MDQPLGLSRLDGLFVEVQSKENTGFPKLTVQNQRKAIKMALWLIILASP